MRSFLGTKSLTVVLGVSLCGVTGYLLYLLFKNDEDDDYTSTLPKQSNHKVLQVKVPKHMVRELIGRNGKNIKSIQEQSNTKINFKDQVTEDDHRICIVRGTHEGVGIAENLIIEYISKQPTMESYDMFVPVVTVAKIIGRCGENIFDIIHTTGAKIKVSEGDRSEVERKIVIKGTLDQINLAKSLIEDIVQRTLESRSKQEEALAKREPRLPSKPSTPSPALSPKCERMSPVPGQSENQFEVYVSAMMDPSHFWVQIVGPKATELDQLVDEMTEYYGKAENRESHQLENITKGDLVAAAFQYDNKWYRAEILGIEDGEDGEKIAELYYVDYGDTDKVKGKDVCELRTDFLRLHFQAIECYLARVAPKDNSNTWPVEAVDKFEEWTYVAQWKKLTAKLNGCQVREKIRAKREGSPVPGVDLFDFNNDKDVDIGQELVKQGYAVFKKQELRASSRAASHNSVDSLQ